MTAVTTKSRSSTIAKKAASSLPSDKRSIKVGLKDFEDFPTSLTDCSSGEVVASLEINLKSLFHHYYLAKYDDDTTLDCGVYEYERRLTSGPDWRFKGGGIGRDKEAKRNVSNELGKAFARWFLHEHFQFAYFSPLEDNIGVALPDGSIWKRRESGDLPDYVCGKDEKDINLLEAKGRYQSVTFESASFETFREQILRAELLDGSGSPISVKGFISVARWATEHTPRVKSKLLVEDPRTEGKRPDDNGYPAMVGRSMIAHHYISPLQRLQLSEFAHALQSGQPMEIQSQRRRGLWRCEVGPLRGRLFVGGIVSTGGWAPPWYIFDEKYFIDLWDEWQHESPFLLNRPSLFFGIEKTVFQSVINFSRRGIDSDATVQPVDLRADDIGPVSFLRDGTMLGPANHFRPIGVIEV